MAKASSKKTQPSRRKSREIALSLLFSVEFAAQENYPEKGAHTGELIYRDEADDAYAGHLFEGVCRDLEAIDKSIRDSSHHWRLERMSLIDRNILRIGVFEILEKQVPIEVIINEAVEIAKIFGDSKSSAFVNGILDAIAKGLDK
ncbi:MAG: transcription antitermination factor NusB [Pseudomonadota bacterium]